MLAAKTTRTRKSGATLCLAHVRAATAVFDTPSPCNYGRGAPFPRADWFGTMLLAETMAVRTSSAPFCRTYPVCTMFPAKSFSNSVAAAASSRASHFVGMVEADTTLSTARISEARVHCADPKSTMLRADKLAKHLRSVATWSSAS